MTRNTALRFLQLPALLLAAAFAFAGAAFANLPDPLEAAPKAPAPGSAVEVAVGELRELVVEDDVAQITVRYRSLVLPDGSALKLRGEAIEGVERGSRVEVVGRKNGATLFVSNARILVTPSAAAQTAKARSPASVSGELRLMHVDYFEAEKSEFRFDVLDDNGNVTALAMRVRPDALQRGMRVTVVGTLDAEGAMDPDTITIHALAPAEPPYSLQALTTNKVLVILMRFTNSPAQPFTQAEVQTAYAAGPGSGSVAEYYKEVSYGQQLLNVTVTPWLNTGVATPAGCNAFAMGTAGRNAATAAGYNTTSYNNLVYVFPKVTACGWLGMAYVGGSGAWINGSNSVLVHGHELGHNLGMLHSANLDCGTNPIGGSCSSSEYADPFSIMGNQRVMHVGAPQKALMGWIAPSAIKTHTSGTSTYTVYPIESAGGSTYAVKVPAAANRTYWLEYRRPIGFDSALASYPYNGAQIRVSTPFETLCGGCDTYSIDSQMLDMTPATTTFTDGALVAGTSFTDPNYGITFNVISATATALTVQVSGPGAGPAPTTTTLASSLNPSTVGAPVIFTATVTGSSPTGSVVFKANGSTISGCSAVSLTGSGNTRTAACSTSALAAGTHAIVATYGGNGANAASTSATFTQTVTAAGGGSANVALASAGGVATASSTSDPGRPPSSLIDNERAGVNWGNGGGWRDGTFGVFPDWVVINFNGSKTIDRVVVYSLQDDYDTPVEPTATMTFSSFGVKDFTVHGWNGSSWVTLATVSNNNLVKRTVTFAAYTTDYILVHITNALADYSRLTEVEAWSVSGAPAPTTTVLGSSINPSTSGAPVTFTATVTGSSPTGTVVFKANGSTISGCSAVSLVGSGNTRTAACSTSALAAGTHAIVATYGGNAANAPSTSATLTQTVNAVGGIGNVALASAGGVAFASSISDPGRPPSSLIDNERAGVNWGNGGGWRDGTFGVFPDWVMISFSGSRTIDRVVVYSLQDDYQDPVEPTATMPFSSFGVKDFTVHGWNGSAWVTLATVSNNSLIKRTVSFAAYTTDHILVHITNALANYSRLTEVEAWVVGSSLTP